MPGSVGKRFVLPSSFTGGPRYMVQNYQDAMAICRYYGPPDIFLTFTCNPKWSEIQTFVDLIPGQKVEDRPDVVARMFKIKLDELMKDLRQRQYFGRVLAVLYTIEFQKRGLPHAHIILFLHPDDKPRNAADIDKIITAELPDKEKDPVGHEKRDNKRTATKNGIEVDNRWVVPHNIDLIVKYQAHINIEWCNQGRSIKYLFKYVNKGKDRATFVIEENVSIDGVTKSTIVNEVDEIKRYLDARYVSASEASWRIFEFDIQYRSPGPDEQNAIFGDDDQLDDVLNKEGIEKTMFTEWMQKNNVDPSARELTYADFPTKFVWHAKEKKWKKRKSGRCIGRIYYAHPSSGENFYLRMLLNIVKGPRCHDDIKTVNGTLYPTYKEACNAFGLLGNDGEWHRAIQEAAQWLTGHKLRELFVTIILFCEVAEPLKLWEQNWEFLSDDILYRQRQILEIYDLNLNSDQLKNYALQDIEKIMNANNRSLKEFPYLPFPDNVEATNLRNRLIVDELCYDRQSLLQEHARLYNGLNADQSRVYDAVIAAVYGDNGGLYFVYGSGGTGKTYLWRTILARLRSEGKIVLAVASSGIASLLLSGGRTSHSRFKIPMLVDDSTCSINQDSPLADLIRRTSLIVWDEAPMQHRHLFETIDRTFKAIMKFHNPSAEHKIFGGKIMLLGGDFRQILPVVAKGGRSEIIAACINKSSDIWQYCQVFLLSINMRLTSMSIDTTEVCTMHEFSKWVLDLGEGKLPTISLEEESEPAWIKIPDDLLIPDGDDDLGRIVETTYPNLMADYNVPEYLRSRAILSPTNDIVDQVNSYMMSLIPGMTKQYLSADTICPSSADIDEQSILYPVEFLNTLKFFGIPDHKLDLKVGVPIILLRNLNQSVGLCNGTVNYNAKLSLKPRLLLETHRGAVILYHLASLSESVFCNDNKQKSRPNF
ncbi:UNVERIFIED_CONTAM: hypothetical protein Sradi_5258400 [Sesamum radiatum]|uniref:ATP-dependent DNA helicase n=1 Tax=Sesamum radiatum TaxID=300843 RepID=A0AAW2LLD6_SESRA